MSRKMEIIIAVVVLILLILALIFVLRPGKVRETDDVRDIPVADGKLDVPAVSAEEIPLATTVGAATLTNIFVERFGSYSSESDFANIDDVLTLASASFQNELQGLAATARRNADEGDAYYGISTKVISTNITEETPSTAKVLAMTQREEAVGSPANTLVKYQNITVDLIKEGEDWKIAGFAWGN